MTLSLFLRSLLVLTLAALWVYSCSSKGGGSATAEDIADLAVPEDGIGETTDALIDTADAAVAQPPPVPGFCEPNNQEFPVRPALTEPATLPFLHVEGLDIVNENGQPVALRGVNFGSWLMMEAWIAGIGVMDEGALLAALDSKAEELGLTSLLAEAKNTNALDWVLEKRSHYPLVLEWRDYCLANAGSDQAAVEALWDWFEEQPWIFEEESLWRWLQGRFGYSAAEQLRLTFQQNYITELDVERVAELGLNLIRVPVWFGSLETDFEKGNHYREEGWLMLHELGVWARRHGVYLMIDLHGTPGGQSTSWHQGLANGGHLWGNQECMAKTVRLWQALATYFAGDSHVAIYDLMNEPMSFPDADSYREVHDAIYQAIRPIDPDHIIMIEDGYRPASQLVSPAEMGWENAMYSVHRYPGGTSANDYLQRMEETITDISHYYHRYQCPLFLGEFTGADGQDTGLWAAESMQLVLSMLNERGVHWAPWTFKYYSDKTIWGLYRPAEAAGVPIDVKDASFEELQGAFEGLNSVNFVPDAGYAKALQDNAGAAPAPLNLEP